MFHDVSYALRMIRRTPLLAGAAVLSLALGIAANLTVVSWLDAFVYQPLAGVPHQSELAVIDGTTPSGESQRLSYPDYLELRSTASGTSGLLVYNYQPFTLATGDHPERVWGQFVSANFFAVLQVQPARGRGFQPGEEERGVGPVAVISDRLWRERFTRSPDILGRTIDVNGVRLTIVGVAPPKFAGVTVGLLLDIWIPVGMQPMLSGGASSRLDAIGMKWLGSYARLRPGTSVASVRDEVRAFGLQLSELGNERARGSSFTATTIADSPWGGTTVLRPVLSVISVVLILVLLLTCANVASLLIVRIGERRSEIALRVALGAGHRRLLQQLSAEGAVLAVFAGILATIASLSSSRVFEAFVPPTGFPVGFSFSVSIRWLLAALGLVTVAAAVFGIASGLGATLSAPMNVLTGRSSRVHGSRHRAWRQAVLGVQIVVAVMLLACAFVLARSLSAVGKTDPGFDTNHILLSAIDLSRGEATPDRGRATLRELLRRISEAPGVRSVSAARRVPLNFGGRGLVQVSIPGHVAMVNEDLSMALNQIGPRYFETMRTAVVAGHEFTERDDDRSAPVAIINEAAARKYWKDRRSLDADMAVNGERVRVVGIVADMKLDDLTGPVAPAVWRPLLQDYRPDIVIHVAAEGDPVALTRTVRQAASSVDARLPLYDIRSMREHMQIPLFAFTLASVVTGAFGALALLLAALGLYAGVAHSVMERRSELALRVALGATGRQVAGTVLQSSGRVVAASTIAGLTLAAGLASAIRSALPGVIRGDPAPYLAALATISAVSVLALAVPTLRAVRVKPAALLK